MECTKVEKIQSPLRDQNENHIIICAPIKSELDFKFYIFKSYIHWRDHIKKQTLAVYRLNIFQLHQTNDVLIPIKPILLTTCSILSIFISYYRLGHDKTCILISEAEPFCKSMWDHIGITFQVFMTLPRCHCHLELL